MNKSMHKAAGTRLSVRDADVLLAGEIASLSHADAGAVWSMLGTSPDGLEPAEANARLAAGGPNLIAKEGRPSVFTELWGRARNPLEQSPSGMNRNSSPLPVRL